MLSLFGWIYLRKKYFLLHVPWNLNYKNEDLVKYNLISPDFVPTSSRPDRGLGFLRGPPPGTPWGHRVVVVVTPFHIFLLRSDEVTFPVLCLDPEGLYFYFYFAPFPNYFVYKHFFPKFM